MICESAEKIFAISDKKKNRDYVLIFCDDLKKNREVNL